MIRREFIALLGGAAVTWPLAARARQPERMRRIIVLMGIANDAEAQARAVALRQGLQALGWTIGRNIQIDYSFANGDAERMRVYAKEAVASGPDLILAVTNPTLQAIRNARSQPIVFLQVSDPVGGGSSKVSRIREATSPVSRILNPRWGANGCRHLRRWHPLWKTWQSFCIRKHRPTLGSCEPQRPRRRLWGSRSPRSVYTTPTKSNRAITQFALVPKGGLIVAPHPVTRGKLTIDLAAHHRLPAIYPFAFHAREGGLLAYGIDQVDQWRNAATYVDRILRGAKPADLPVQQPTKYELVINLKTAKALGLQIPDRLLALADEVIE